MVGDETASVRRLIDKDQIIDLVHEYSYCVDHRMFDAVVDLLTEDCVVDFGPGIAPVRSRAALRAMFGRSAGGFAATSHHNANVLVTFDGATPQVWGYYHDAVVRLPEGWRIAYRQPRVLGAEDWQMEMHAAVDPGGG